MLFQNNRNRTATAILRRSFAFIAGIAVGLTRQHGDQAYLDGMRPRELEELGLRRSDDGGYRFF